MSNVVCSIRNILADVTDDPLEAPSLVADARARDERAQSRRPESRIIGKRKSKSYLAERVDTKSPNSMDVGWLQELTPRAPQARPQSPSEPGLQPAATRKRVSTR